MMTPQDCIECLRTLRSSLCAVMADEAMSVGGPPNPQATEWTQEQGEEATRLLARIAVVALDHLTDQGYVPEHDHLSTMLENLAENS